MDALEFLTKDHETIKALLATANTHEEMKAVFAAMNKVLDARFAQLIQEARAQHDPLWRGSALSSKPHKPPTITPSETPLSGSSR